MENHTYLFLLFFYDMKLVFDYTYCDFPECWEWNIPFEYESKEKFLSDVLYNPMMLNDFGISVHQFQVDNGTIY